MSYHLLEYALVEDYLARRDAFRDAHLALARAAAERGDLVLAGALADPPDRALLVWQAEDPSVVERPRHQLPGLRAQPATELGRGLS